MLLRSLLAFILLAANAGLAQTPQAAGKPLTVHQIEDLLKAGADSARIADVVKARGIDFSPTQDYLDSLRSKGAKSVLIAALRAAVSPPLTKDELAQMVAKGEDANLLEMLIQHRGIDFTPTDEYVDTLRIAGANGAVLEAVRRAKRVIPIRAEASNLKPPSTQSSGGPYSVGGNVSAPIPIYKPEPPYSKEAREAKYQGTVVLWIVVDAQGNVTDVRVVKPLGLGLDEKAVEAVHTWKFKPAMRNSTPVPVRVTVEISFRLSGKPATQSETATVRSERAAVPSTAPQKVRAPLSPTLLEAHRVLIRASGTGASTDVLNDTYKFFTKWDRFTVVSSIASADVVVEISEHFQGMELNQWWARGQVLSFNFIVVEDRTGHPLWWVRVVPGTGQTKPALGKLKKEIQWHEKHGNSVGQAP